MLTFLKSFVHKHHRALFYSAWLVIHIIQASTTDLFDDEAYYWVYSLFPDWGYFDHPPVIALLIKGGYAVFHNELGVRFLAILLATASVFLVENLIEKKNAYLFYAIFGSLALAQIGGMIAVPDTPLLFSIALFFCLYKRFIANRSVVNAFLLGACIALMLYTKYHSILIVVFTGLSNLKLLKHYQTYLVLLLSIALFIPHLYWQHQHGYPSVRFHLFERNEAGYSINFTIEYLIGQVVLAGPLMGWLLLLSAFKYKPASQSEKALKFSFAGIYLFFLVATFRGKVEANWTVPAFIGMIVLSHGYLSTHARWRRWLYYSLPATLFLVFAARAIMMIDLPPRWWIIKDEFHNNRSWVKEIKQKAGTMPVVFFDSYQKPSKYWYYSGDTAMGLNSLYYRRNNFNFWEIEDHLIGRPVYAVSGPAPGFDDTFKDIHLENSRGKKISLYYSFSRVLIDQVKYTPAGNNKIVVRFRTATPASYLTYFRQSPYDTALFYLVLYKEKKLVACLPAAFTVKNINREKQENVVSFQAALPPGDYTGKLAIGSCLPDRPSINSSEILIKILNRF